MYLMVASALLLALRTCLCWRRLLMRWFNDLLCGLPGAPFAFLFATLGGKRWRVVHGACGKDLSCLALTAYAAPFSVAPRTLHFAFPLRSRKRRGGFALTPPRLRRPAGVPGTGGAGGGADCGDFSCATMLGSCFRVHAIFFFACGQTGICSQRTLWRGRRAGT